MKRTRRAEDSEFAMLVAKIYDAAANPKAWDDALRSVRKCLRTQSAMLFTEDLDSHRVDLSVTDKASGKLIQEYYDYYIHKSPLLKAKLSVPFGEVTATNLLMPDREWERHEFYYDFLRRCERFYEMGALLAKDGERVSVLSLIRAKRAGGFARTETERLRRLLPHIRRSLEIGRRIGAASQEQASLAALMDRVTTGVILFNEQAQAVYLNRRAEELISDGHCLTLKKGEIAAQTHAQTEQILKVLHAAIRTSIGDGQRVGAGVTLHRRGSGHPLKVLVAPLRVETLSAGSGGARVCAAMFLSEPGGSAALQPDVLKELFGLTEAEALVAGELANGRTPQEVSRSLNISWHTVRSQQRAIYDKLGVSSQAQLVKAVLSSPASINVAAPMRREV
jgi:DNA-binding CsgD family transcriptional regulator/PAS domain-containing protein